MKSSKLEYDTKNNILSYLRRLKSLKSCLKEEDKKASFNYEACKEILSEIEEVYGARIFVVKY